jgi:methionine synthase I (cobalamin-dependent)
MLWKLGLQPPSLLDGALGTELLKEGFSGGKSTIICNTENPASVLKIHRSYVDAGCEIISSNTFAGNIIALEKAGLAASEEELNLIAMKLVKEAGAGRVKIAADIGPTGEFYSAFNESNIRDIYIRQVEILQRDPPDFYFLETFYDLREALAGLKGVKTICDNIPVAVSMTFKKTKRGFFSLMGDPADKALRALQDAGADAVGCNCTLEPPEMLELLRIIRPHLAIPLIMQPNAGQPEIAGDKIVYKVESEVFAQGLSALASEGADIIGGCCGSTPEMMAKTRMKREVMGKR